MESTSGKELTIQEVIIIFRRRRMIVISTLLLFILVAVLYCTFCTRRYEALGIIQMQKESADAMGLESLMEGGADSANDVLGVNVELQTQANILKSDTLGIKTIEQLHLADTADFRQGWSPRDAIMRLFSSAKTDNQANLPLEQSPERRRRALKVFEDNLTVKPVSGTRLIVIGYQNPDPKVAADVVNTMMQALVDYTFQTRYSATNQTAKWLGDQLNDLRRNSQDLQAKVVDLERRAGVYGLDLSDKNGVGQQQLYSDILIRLQQSTLGLEQAVQNRVIRGAIARAAASGDADTLSSLAGNSGTMNNTLALLQGLREQESSAQAALKQAEAKYGPNYSRVTELRGQLSSIQASIKEEVSRIRARAESDYQVSLQTEKELKEKYADVKQQADQANDKAIEFTIARQDAIESRSLYEGLLRRLNAAGVLAGLKSSNITVVDPGRVPARPKVPNIPLCLAIAVGGGLLIGGFGAIAADELDNKIKNENDAEVSIGGPVFGVLPKFDTAAVAGSIYSAAFPQSLFTEAIRAIRTALLLSRSERPPQVILVTSSVAGEGKTEFTINMATMLAHRGGKVLVVDADLRRGTISRRVNIQDSGLGLSELLSGVSSEPKVNKVAEVNNLYVLAAGHPPPNPSELLDSQVFIKFIERCKTEYDYILLDSPPCLPVTDSVSIVPLADLVIYIARVNASLKSQLKRGYSIVSQNDKCPVGVVLNCANARENSYYEYYGYSSNGGGYGYVADKNDNA